MDFERESFYQTADYYPDLRRRDHFRDKEGETRVRKTNPRRDNKSYKRIGKWSLLEAPEPYLIGLLREAGLQSRLYSSEALRKLESHFHFQMRVEGMAVEEVKSWPHEDSEKKERVQRILRGRVFEDLITREFRVENPNHIATTDYVTRQILQPVIIRSSLGEFSLPDHAVFERLGYRQRLVGFLEDKEIRGHRRFEEFDVMNQLQKQYDLWQRIATSPEDQVRLRRRLYEIVPTRQPIEVAPANEGVIWIAVPRESQLKSADLPSWTRVFRSRVTNEAVHNFVGRLFYERFIPHYLASNQDQGSNRQNI